MRVHDRPSLLPRRARVTGEYQWPIFQSSRLSLLRHPLFHLQLSYKMCGIVVAHGLDNPALERPRIIACAKKIRHRGPDWSGCHNGKQTILAHERLAIVGVGMQTLIILNCTRI